MGTNFVLTATIVKSTFSGETIFSLIGNVEGIKIEYSDSEFMFCFKTFFFDSATKCIW